MSRPSAKPRPDHRIAADQARQLPGQWVLAGTYPSSVSAKGASLQVRTGTRLPAYRPAGAFEARTEITQDGVDLWVRYLDQAGRDFRESIQAGLTEDLGAFSSRLDAATNATPGRPRC
ncbi:hypothetical protein ACWD25_48205 [Streptomyces sp. NPDC002920]